MSQGIPVLTLSLRRSDDEDTAIPAHRFVDIDVEQVGIIDRAIGVTRHSAMPGDLVAVDVLGTTIVEAGGPFYKGNRLMPNDGRAVLRTDDLPALAIALQDAPAAGALVEVLLVPHASPT